MPRLRPLSLIAALSWLAPACDGFFVLLKEGKECFVIEQPLDTPLVVRYEIPVLERTGMTASEPGLEGDASSGPPVGVKMTLVDRHTHSIVFSKILASHKGEESMSTVSEANHELCVKPVTNRSAGPCLCHFVHLPAVRLSFSCSFSWATQISQSAIRRVICLVLGSSLTSASNSKSSAATVRPITAKWQARITWTSSNSRWSS